MNLFRLPKECNCFYLITSIDLIIEISRLKVYYSVLDVSLHNFPNFRLPFLVNKIAYNPCYIYILAVLVYY